MIERSAFFVLFAEGGLARLIDTLRHAVHGPVQRFIFPLRAVRSAIFDRCPAPLIDVQLEACGTFGAEAAAIDRTVLVALNIDDLAIFDVHTLSAANRAVRAYALHHLRIFYAWFQVFCPLAGWVRHQAYVGLQDFAKRVWRETPGQFTKE